MKNKSHFAAMAALFMSTFAIILGSFIIKNYCCNANCVAPIVGAHTAPAPVVLPKAPAPTPVIAEALKKPVSGKPVEFFKTNFDLYERSALKIKAYTAFIKVVKDENKKPELVEQLEKYKVECETIAGEYNAEAAGADPSMLVGVPKSISVDTCK
jgi:hypothetical protein